MRTFVRGTIIGVLGSTLVGAAYQFTVATVELKILEGSLLRLLSGESMTQPDLIRFTRFTFRSVDHPIATALAVAWQDHHHPLGPPEPSSAA